MKTATIIFSLVFSLAFCSPAFGHDGHKDPALQEINDYLMAIQLMRIKDAGAANIFKTWHELRTESWEIRNLTDEQNLLITSVDVMKQISKTRAKQKQLLKECRAYFSKLIEQEPAMLFTIGKSITSSWEAPLFEVQQGHFKVLLVEIKNNRNSKVKLSMNGDYSDEILFWNKQFTLEANASRYTFVVLSPLRVGKVSCSLHISDEVGEKANVLISVNGIPMVEKPFVLTPDSIPTHVIVPSNNGHPINKTSDFSESINFSVTDKESGKPLAARVEVSDRKGNNFWNPLKGPSYAVKRNMEWGWHTTLWEYQPGPYFYIGGQAELGVNPVGKIANIYHGFEYIPAKVEVPGQGNVDVALERWINMPDLGWYSGQTHIHTTDIGIPVQFSKFWPLVSQAEDLHISSILTLKGEWQTHAIYANEFPLGQRQAFSTPDHLITYGEEFRNNPYGHLAFIGLKSLIQPISTGALGELGGPDYPPNAYILEEAVTQGATTIAAHFGNFTEGVDQIRTGWPSTGFEMPVDIALGNIHMAEIAGNGGQRTVWYDILNCGFKIPATAGPDWAIKDTPRVYVNLENEEFTLNNWRRNLQNGKSFITTGPMLFFKVNDELPGSSLNAGNGPVQFQVEASALTPEGKIPVEIIYNGKVILTATDVSRQISLEDSGWIAARCKGAHTNPIYINFKDRPAGYAEPARKFIAVIDRLTEWVNTKALFYNENQKEEVLEVIENGRAVYENIIQRAEELNRR